MHIMNICIPQVCNVACNALRICCGKEQHYHCNGQLICKFSLVHTPLDVHT